MLKASEERLRELQEKYNVLCTMSDEERERLEKAKQELEFVSARVSALRFFRSRLRPELIALREEYYQTHGHFPLGTGTSVREL